MAAAPSLAAKCESVRRCSGLGLGGIPSELICDASPSNDNHTAAQAPVPVMSALPTALGFPGRVFHERVKRVVWALLRENIEELREIGLGKKGKIWTIPPNYLEDLATQIRQRHAFFVGEDGQLHASFVTLMI